MKEPKTCSGTWQVLDFPKHNHFFEQSIKIHGIENNCQFHSSLLINYYGDEILTIGDSFQGTLTIRQFSREFYGKVASELLIIHQEPPLLDRWRNNLNQRIRSEFNPALQKWWQALLIGNQNKLNTQDRLLLQRTATSHLVAISGLHIGLIIAIIFFTLLSLLAQWRFIHTKFEPRSVALILSLLISGVYVLITGAQPPVFRAWFMYLVIVCTWFVPFIRDKYAGIYLAALFLLMIDPNNLFSLSAQLSFLATFAVIAIYQRVKNKQPLYQWFFFQLLITLLLIPFTWAVWGGFSLIGLLINLLLIPWLGFIIFIGLFALAFPFLAIFADFCLRMYLTTIQWGASLSWGYIEFSWQPNIISGLLLSILLLVLIMKHYKFILPISCMMVIGNLWPASSNIYYLHNQQSGILFSENHTIIINSAYRNNQQDNNKRYLITELRRRGKTPDALVITSNRLSATRGIKTILEYYPDTAIYSLIPLKNFPFSYQYCPTATSPYVFIKDYYCEMIIDGKWRISSNGVTLINDAKNDLDQ